MTPFSRRAGPPAVVMSSDLSAHIEAASRQASSSTKAFLAEEIKLKLPATSISALPNACKQQMNKLRNCVDDWIDLQLYKHSAVVIYVRHA